MQSCVVGVEFESNFNCIMVDVHCPPSFHHHQQCSCHLLPLKHTQQPAKQPLPSCEGCGLKNQPPSKHQTDPDDRWQQRRQWRWCECQRCCQHEPKGAWWQQHQQWRHKPHGGWQQPQGGSQRECQWRQQHKPHRGRQDKCDRSLPMQFSHPCLHAHTADTWAREFQLCRVRGSV